jgi:hypothetical protein
MYRYTQSFPEPIGAPERGAAGPAAAQTAAGGRVLLGPLFPLADPTHKPVSVPASGSNAVLAGVSHYSGFVRAADLPSGIPNTPNLRSVKLSTPVSREVRASLLADDGEFHLKNKGIVVVADSVLPAEEYGEGFFWVSFARDVDGILDGGHTYAIIQDVRSAGHTIASQYVSLRVSAHVPTQLKVRMAEGLNKSTAVARSSLLNGAGAYQWLADALPEHADRIAWRQNDPGEAHVEALLQQLYALNLSVASGRSAAYSGKKAALDALGSSERRIQDYAPLCEDAFRLAERIEVVFSAWAAEKLEGRATAKARPPLFDESGPHARARVVPAIARPVLGAFRACVVEREGKFHFDRDFAGLVDLLSRAGSEIRSEIERLWCGKDIGGVPNRFGKSEAAWYALEKVVAKHARVRPAEAGDLPNAETRRSLSAGEHAPALCPIELAESWEEELSALEASIERQRAALPTADRSERDVLINKIANDSSKALRYKEAIARGRSGLVAVCSSCGGRVEDDRALEAHLSLACSRCAR